MSFNDIRIINKILKGAHCSDEHTNPDDYNGGYGEVQHFPRAEAGGGGDTGGFAKGVVAQQVHCEGIDLSNCLSSGVDQHDVAQDALVGLFPKLVEAVGGGSRGATDMFCANQLVARSLADCWRGRRRPAYV